MTTSLTTRITAGTGATVKNSPLTSAEVDNNFLSLNDNKLENTGGSINGNLTITGNLTVSGTTVTIDATNLAVADNMIYLNDGSTVSNPDLGFAGNYNDGTYAHTGVFRDADDGRWKFYEGYTPEPDASAFIDTGHASFTLAEVQASTFYGDLSGNATSATSAGKLSTARTIQLSGDVTGSASFDGSAAINITTTVADNSHSHSNYLPVAGGTLTGKLVAGSTDGDSLEIRNDTAAAASSSYITFTNKNETDTYRPASRISGVTVDNAFDGDFLVETYSGGVAYKGLRVDENSKVFFYDTTGNTKFEWDSVNTRALINNNVIWHAGNDGSGSGLDADLLDGNHASAFALSGHTHSYLPLSGGTLTGNLTMGTNAIYGSSTSYALDFNSTDITLTSVGDIWLYADSNDNETTRYINLAAGQNTLKIYGGAGSQTDSITYNGNKVWHAGNDGSGSGLDADLLDGNHASAFALSAHTHSIDSITDEYRIFNNMGNNHTSYTNFNSFPNFGHYYAQGGTNGPTGSGTDQFYGMFLGLGNEYSSTQYGSQFYWGRQGTGTADKYIWIRDLENGTWGSWRKPYVGKADTWTTARTLTLTGDVTGSVSWDGSANVSLTTTVADDSHSHSNYLPLSGGTMTGVINMSGTQKITTAGFAGIEYWNNSTWQVYIGTESNTAGARYNSRNGVHTWYNNSTQTMQLSGNNLTIVGALNATSKSFLIDHPTKPGMKLRYGSLEGPENGVYVRGRLKGKIIELPDYWTKLVDPDSITVQLTSMGRFQKLYVKEIADNKVVIGNGSWFSNNTDCFYVVYAERVDVDKLEVEIY